MASGDTSVPVPVIDAALRHIFADLGLPEAGATISDRALVALVRSQKRSGYSTLFEVEGRSWTAHKTDFGPRLWIASDWNKDPPSLRETYS